MPDRLRSEQLGAPDAPGRIAEERADKPDRYGEWLADDARIWRVYGQLAKEDDKEKVQRWSGGLNNLAIFATLFSGITTAFIIESQNDLKPDFAELAYRVQNATAHGRAYVEEPFVIAGQARVVNCLWITSLLLSLSAALIAVMGQDWVEMYFDKPVCNPRQWAEIRSFRLNGVYRWYMPGAIATAPVLLHASLFLFGIGLAIFMASDVITRNLCVALCAAIAFLYAVTTFSAVFWSSSPFRSPATVLVRRCFCATFHRNGDKNSSLAPYAAILNAAHRSAALRGWIQKCLLRARAVLSHVSSPYRSPNFLSRLPTTYRDHVLSHYGPNSHVWTHVLHQWFCAAFRHVGNDSPLYDWMHNLLSKFRTTFGMIISRYPPWLLDFWTVIRRWYSATFDGCVPPSPGWIRRCYTNFRTEFGFILEKARPDFSNGWSDISERPSPALVADSLHWLSSASTLPEVTQLLVAGLCDHIIGPQVCAHANARSTTQQLRQYADGQWERMSILDLSRYVIISATAGQRDWPDSVKRRFKGILESDINIPQDFLLALVYLVIGLRDAPWELQYSWNSVSIFLNVLHKFERLCARLPDRSPITLSTITSILVPPSSRPNGDSEAFERVAVLINKWLDVLPTDLRPVEQALREMLAKDVVEQTNRLTCLCECALNRPIDNILHMLIAFFAYRSEVYTLTECNLVGDSALSLAQSASDSGKSHSCLIVIFGNDDLFITSAAWGDLPHKVESALDLIRPGVSVDDELRPMLARMIARCIAPPFSVHAEKISHIPLRMGRRLLKLVEKLSNDGALPDHLFRRVLESGALGRLSASPYRTAPGGDRVWDFVWILAAIALWIKAQSHDEVREELFGLFAATRAADSAEWNLADAMGAAISSLGGTSDHRGSHFYTFLPACSCLLSAMRPFRKMFPGPDCTLWADLAFQFGANYKKQRHSAYSWPQMRSVVQDATGVDPEQFSQQNTSLSAYAAAQRAASATGGSPAPIEPTTIVVSAGIDAHPASHIAWIAAGATPEDGL